MGIKIDKSLNPEIIWAMFKENALQFKAIREQFKETDKRFKETRELLDEKFLEVKVLFQNTDRKINKMIGHFDKQIGKLIEALTEQCTLKLFQGIGINITHSSLNPERNLYGKTMEFDTILLNKTELVIIEAKVTLTKQKVYQFAKKMEYFKTFFSEFESYKVYSCLAYLTSKSDAEELANEKGYFLIKLKKDNYFEFNNSENFIPTIS